MKKATILVVEDEGIVAQDIQSSLQILGYTVPVTISSGEEAIKKTAEIKPDLVLMDIKLNGRMDGIEAAEQIKTFYDIPIVYLTAFAEKNELQRAKITEPYGYLIKPIDEKELHSTIEMALYKHKTERELKENEQWLITTLKSIGDGLITTDYKEQITFMNHIAEDLIGWKKENSLGKSLTQVFTIIDEVTKVSPECPVSKAIREKVSVNLTNKYILITKNKSTIPVDIKAAPIINDKENIIGALLIFWDISERKQSENKLKQSLEKLQRTLSGTVNALAQVTEKRDPYTAGHQQRVAQLACAIAKEMGISEELINGLQVAAIVHDIGKIYVPAEILSKPSRLSSTEFDIIKSHPKVGYDILKTIEFPWPVAQIVLQHHEKINGTGYPLGLRGEDILLEAKILCVADVVEAMSFHRPYRPAYGIKKALEEIVQNRGILYDSRVVDVCLKLFKKKIFKFKSE